MSKALQWRLYSTKDVYVPIIPSENDLGKYYEDKNVYCDIFSNSFFAWPIFYEYSQTHLSHPKGGNHFVNQIAQYNTWCELEKIHNTFFQYSF